MCFVNHALHKSSVSLKKKIIFGKPDKCIKKSVLFWLSCIPETESVKSPKLNDVEADDCVRDETRELASTNSSVDRFQVKRQQQKYQSDRYY